MTKIIYTKNNFNLGEISPRLYGRTDIEKYKTGLKEATNCTVLPHGPVVRRTGFKYIAEIKDSTKRVRLVRFQFSNTDYFVLEIGDTYIRFYTNQGVVLSGGVPYEITVPYLEADLQQLEYVQFGNNIYIAHGGYLTKVLTRTTSTNWSIASLNPVPEPTVEDGLKPVATLTPSATTGSGINFTASTAVFLEADVGRPIRNLAGSGEAVITAFTSTTVVVCTITEDFPNTTAISSQDWKIANSPISELTSTGKNEGSVVTVTSDIIGTTTDFDTFRSADVGNFIYMNGGILEILSITNAFTIQCQVLKSLNTINETAVWTLEQSAWTTAKGYPKTIGLHEQRLLLGSTTTYPQTIYMSESGIFDGFGIGSAKSDSIEVTLSSSEVNQISWLASSRVLIVGTVGAEITITSNTGSITPDSIDAKTRTYIGSNLQKPVIIEDDVIYIQNSAEKVRTMRYNFNIDNYESKDMTLFSEHLGLEKIVELAHTKDPDSILYAVTSEGNLLACTYQRDQDVLGWCKFTTDGIFENIVSIKNNNTDELWAIIKRNINGTSKRFIEVLVRQDPTSDISAYSDSWESYNNPKTISAITKANPGVLTSNAHGYSNGDQVKILNAQGMTELNGIIIVVANVATNTFELHDRFGTPIDTTNFTTYIANSGTVNKLITSVSGLDHLEGKTVEIKADGASHVSKVVTSGAITLDRPSYNVVVGLPYQTKIVTLNPELNTGPGSSQGQQIRFARPILRVYQSTKPIVNGNLLPARTPSDLMDSKVSLYSGDLEYGPTDWNNSSSLTITVDEPFPLLLNAIFSTTDIGIK